MSAAAPRRVLLIGGTSEIGLAIVRRLAQDTPVQPVLLGRDATRLAASRVARHSPSRGYMATSASGRVRASLVR